MTDTQLIDAIKKELTNRTTTISQLAHIVCEKLPPTQPITTLTAQNNPYFAYLVDYTAAKYNITSATAQTICHKALTPRPGNCTAQQ